MASEFAAGIWTANAILWGSVAATWAVLKLRDAEPPVIERARRIGRAISRLTVGQLLGEFVALRDYLRVRRLLGRERLSHLIEMDDSPDKRGNTKQQRNRQGQSVHSTAPQNPHQTYH